MGLLPFMQRTRRRNIPCSVGWLAVVGAKMCATCSVGAAFSQVVFLGGGKMHTFRVGGHLTVYFPRSPRKGGCPTRYLCTPTSSGSPITPQKTACPQSASAASLIKATARAKTPQALAATSPDVLRLPVGLVCPAHMPNSNVNSYFVVGPSPNGVRPLLLAASLTATERLKR